MEEVKGTDVLVVMGDFNAKVGAENSTVTGNYGLGERNESGERLVQFCQEEQLIIANTLFQHPKKNLYTWSSPGDQYRNQIDYILVRRRFRNSIKNVKTYPGADIMSDHCLLLGKFKVKIKRVKKSQKKPKYDLDLLKQTEYKQKFSLEVRNRFETLMNEEPVQEDEIDVVEREWKCLKSSIIAAEEHTIPKKVRRKDNEWMTQEILDLMDDRRRKRNTPEYKRINTQIQAKCRERKEIWYNDKCREIEDLERNHRMREMHEKVRLVTDRKSEIRSKNECIRDKDGKLLFEKDEISRRWTEYIKELYDDPQRRELQLGERERGPGVIKEEVLHAIKYIRSGKAGGSDGVLIEHLKALDDETIDIVVNICQKIYENGHLPEDLKHSNFIKIPKKPNAQECSDHRTISLMSHMVKVVLKVVLQRIEDKIEGEISESQSGFREGVGTREGILNLRLIVDKYLEARKNIYICFIDYTKAFDCVKHEDLIRCLERLPIDKNDINLLYNLYWKQTASLQIKDGDSDTFSIKKGVRQGCIVSPKLFNLYTEEIFKVADDLPGINIGGQNITNLRYADDTALVSETEDGLQKIVNKVKEESERKGLKMNIKKTKTMVVSRSHSNNDKIHITVNGKVLEQVKSFKYLGQTISDDGTTDVEVRKRIAIARQSFVNMKDVLTTKSMKIETRKRLFRCYILSSLLYAGETWILNKAMQEKLEAFEMWAYRRMLKISYTDHITNQEVLRRVKERKPSLVSSLIKRKTQYFGHAIRKDKIQKLLITGKINGRRSRGRPRRTWVGDITIWSRRNLVQCVRMAEDRFYWAKMTADMSKTSATCR